MSEEEAISKILKEVNEVVIYNAPKHYDYKYVATVSGLEATYYVDSMEGLYDMIVRHKNDLAQALSE